MSEIISGIQVIKMYAWEKPFEKLIEHLRAREIVALTQSSYLRGFFSSCNVFVERFTLFLTVVAYSLVGYRITADMVFSMAQYFNILQRKQQISPLIIRSYTYFLCLSVAMAIIYPLAVSLSAETWVAIKRLEEILVLEEKEEIVIENLTEKGISLNNITASWVPDVPVLKNIDVVIPEGKLCAIIGPVGAGKSSVLQVFHAVGSMKTENVCNGSLQLLIGELSLSSGKIQIGGSLSFSSQEPWLFAASVRKNILFGKPYDSTLYKKVAEVCALEKDFEQFPYGKSFVY